eukprot:TRINITY_DN25924_c0_g1_i1.p1 TRINITY_DN25924_c0_g1~~TRINITY_DN25924_c0_g1_i1.p1  ORF type:complete len:707 (-),score=97.49 TRINITY_DN25924_c0_g1_i1:185-2305(-)
MGSSGKGRGRGGQSSGAFFGGGGYASHGEYMVEKNRKLKEQFAAAAQCSLAPSIPSEASKTSIFKGCSFWMTGRTCIPDQELKRLIVEHGGLYEQYGFTRVSHVIADNLAAGNQTWGELKRRLKRCNVVTSSWITDSVREGKRIPESRYMPKCLQASSSMLSFMGQSRAKRAAGEVAGEELSGAAERIGRPSLSSSVIDDETRTENTRDVHQQHAEGSISSVCVQSQYGGDIEEQQMQQTRWKRRYQFAPKAASSASPSLSAPSVAVAARKQLQPCLDGRADTTLGSSTKALPAVLPYQSLRAPSPLALEISASCPNGLRGGLSELHELLAELGANANKQLKDAQRPALAAGLQISVEEPCLHEWSSTADLPAGPTDAEEMMFVLRCLAGRAVITLGLINPAQSSGSSFGPVPSSVQEQVDDAMEGSGLLAWTTVRRVAIQVRCGPVHTDTFQQPSTRTAPNAPVKDSSLALDGNHIRGALSNENSMERSSCSQNNRSDVTVVGDCSNSHSDTQAAHGNNNSMERSSCSTKDRSDITVVGDCPTSSSCEVDDVIACSRSPLRVHRNKRPRWKDLPGVVNTDMSAEQLMDIWRASCQTHLGISEIELRQLASAAIAGNNSAEKVRTATLSCHMEAFQLLVAKHEFDVVASALRALQAAAECRVASTLHVDGLPPHSCFNMLLSKVQRIVSTATAGARLHIQPLPKDT